MIVTGHLVLVDTEIYDIRRRSIVKYGMYAKFGGETRWKAYTCNIQNDVGE